MLSRYVVSQVKHNSYFLCGVIIGLWVALVAVPFEEEGPVAACAVSPTSAAPDDEYAPVHETRPPSGGGGAAAARSVQRPRYYSTELGMRGSLLAGVLTGENSAPYMTAINQTAAALLPALRFFITAGAPPSESTLPRPNVVGFTDTREMLKPFHTLKYLADTYLEEYNFFYLVTDRTFINALKVKELASKLSVSQDVYMGVPADDGSQYCSLDTGILISNSVLRAMYGSLDWCVRNSYSPHHHENIGRCVLHAAHVSCTSEIQGARYSAVEVSPERLPTAAAAVEAAAAVVDSPRLMYLMHAYVARLQLELCRSREGALSAAMSALRRAPSPPRVATAAVWPSALRRDVTLPPPSPDSRWDLPRWTLLNVTHALFADDTRAAKPHEDIAAHRRALMLVLEAAGAWLRERSPGDTGDTGGTGDTGDSGVTGDEPRLVEGARRWEPPVGLRYRLLMEYKGRMRMLEVMRPLGAARLVHVPYVTESAHVTLVMTVTSRSSRSSPAALERWLRGHASKDNTDVIVVLISSRAGDEGPSRWSSSAREAVARLGDPTVRVLDVTDTEHEHDEHHEHYEHHEHHEHHEHTEHEVMLAVSAALQLVRKDALLLTVTDDMEFNDEFLNRVRMNTISGTQWYMPVPFRRHSQTLHPRYSSTVNTGRFTTRSPSALAASAADLASALRASSPSPSPSLGASLLAAGVRCVRAPDPALVLAAPPSPPCPRGEGEEAACLARLPLEEVPLGARHSLAKLLLETMDDVTV